MEVVKLLDLPITTMAPLAAGYVGYRLSFIGRNSAHKATDVIFLTLAFAVAAKFEMLAVSAYIGELAATPLAFLMAAIVAVGWRTKGDNLTREWLRQRMISDHDGQPNVWQSMLARQLPGPSQVVVRLKGGNQYMCAYLSKFEKAPLGPCLFGEDGSVALYVTHHMPKDADDWIEMDPSRSPRSYDMTFIPAAEITSVDVTRGPDA